MREGTVFLTLMDLNSLLKRWGKIALVLSLAFAAIVPCATLLWSPPVYTAVANVIANDPSGEVSPSSMLAVANDAIRDEVKPYTVNESDTKVEIEIGGSALLTLSISVESPSEQESIDLANSLAENAASEAERIFEALQQANEADLAELVPLNDAEDVASVLSGTVLQSIIGPSHTFEFCSFSIEEATGADKQGANIVLLVVLGLVSGVFVVAICAIIFDAVKAPVKNRRDVEALTGMPVLNYGHLEILGEQVWANLQFSAPAGIHSVCVVSLDSQRNLKCVESLCAAIGKTGKEAVVCPSDSEEDCRWAQTEVVVFAYPSPSVDADVAYCAHRSDATIVCVRQWIDSSRTLVDVLERLALAQANVAGLVLLPDEK